jgi:hypothetical protein
MEVFQMECPMYRGEDCSWPVDFGLEISDFGFHCCVI